VNTTVGRALIDTYGSTLVRTDLRDDDAWQALLSAIETPSEEGFLATVRAVSDPVISDAATTCSAPGHRHGPREPQHR
jgi:hypothetical protein